ncbi:VanW family protein, partial [Candidatus Peregrinibacteria bacterium]|nr:VanW family protein [Candidatus Peregrinibacteria bacterium]
LRIISQKFPDIPKSKNASLVRDGKDIAFKEAKLGLSPQLEDMLFQVKRNIDFFEHNPLFVDFHESPPGIFAADLEPFKDRIRKLLPSALKLVSGKETWTVDFTKNPEWLLFERKQYAVADGEFPFTIQWDPLRFAEFTDRFLAEKLEQAPDDVRIFRDGPTAVRFEGFGDEGRAIKRERLLTLANIAIRDRLPEVEIPTEVVSPKVEVSADLAPLGIQELLAVGHTRFAGSPANRQHNIGVGIKRFNGLLIAPGATFSFGENLGTVDDSTGYRKELVIKPEGTIPEYGGGICQVSSTVYRAALFAGLPITQRKAHSYVVSYYAQVGGHGLDATVYPPAVDLKFINDTPGYIAIQSYVDGVDAYFKLYGMPDGRKVEMQGPTISNRRAAPTEPLYVPDSTLPPGEKKQVEKAHAGFDVLWNRIISRSNQLPLAEKIISRYKAVPDKFLVGGEVLPSDAKKDVVEEVNPYE